MIARIAHSHIGAATAVTIGFALFLAGCGGTPDDPRGTRVGVKGTVQLDGQPLDNAHILFISSQKNGTVKATATIRDGQFSIDWQHGPLTGESRVKIVPAPPSLELFQASQARRPLSRKNRQLQGVVSIPEKYNKKSELTAQISANADDNVFNFALASK